MPRPTVMTEPVLEALRQAFLIGATNLEAAHYAGITEKTLYNYIDKHPEYLQQIEAWKSEPILKAKQTIIKNMHDTKNAQWYLERKAKDFKQKVEMEGGQNPIRVLLQAYGIDPEKISQGVIDDGQDDGAISTAPTSEA